MTHRDQIIEELYKKYWNRMIAWAGRFFSDRADCEDAVQEVFLRVVSHNDLKLEIDSPQIASLLRVILHNVCVSELEKRKKYLPADLSEESSFLYPHAQSLSENWQAQFELEDELHRALAQLKPEVQDMLWLSVKYGYSAREIGELFNKRTTAVRQALSRARKELCRILKGGQHEE